VQIQEEKLMFDTVKKLLSKRPKPRPAEMARLARCQSTASRSLTARREYRALSPAGRQLVKAVLLEGTDPNAAGAALPNGYRLLDSQAVQRCLAAAGWNGAASPTDQQAPINEPGAPFQETPPKPEDISLNPLGGVSSLPSPTEPKPVPEAFPPCGCGRPSTGLLNGNHVCNFCYLRRLGIPLSPKLMALEAISAASTSAAELPGSEIVPADRVQWRPNPETREERLARIIREEEAERQVVIGSGATGSLTELAGNFDVLNGRRVRYATLEENNAAWAEYDRQAEAEDTRLRAEYSREMQRQRDQRAAEIHGHGHPWGKR